MPKFFCGEVTDHSRPEQNNLSTYSWFKVFFFHLSTKLLLGIIPAIIGQF